ncbi:MAG: hypothetical protein ACJAZO_001998 [Myxococcota bacterium]
MLDPSAWLEDPTADPLPDHRQTDAPCLPLGVEQELGGIEIQTGDCPYAILSQPILADVRAGRSLTLLAWHNDLIAPEPSAGHLLLIMGGQTLIDWTPEIPSDADVVDETVVLLQRVQAGDMAILHLHNHGANTWNVNAVEVGE